MRPLSSQPRIPPPALPRGSLALFLVLGLFSFALVVPAFFVADDFWILGTLARQGPGGVWFHGPGGFFRPFASLDLYLDLHLWGTHPAGYHLVNVLLHSACAFLLSLLAFRLEEKSSRTARGVSPRLFLLPGLFFLLLPNHAETVNWISCRVDLLAAFFSLAALVLLFSGPGPGRLLLSLLSFCAALLSKESAAALPAAVFLLAGPSLRARIRRAVPFVLVLCAYILLRHHALQAWIGGYGATKHLALGRTVKHLPLHFLRSFLPPMPSRTILYLAGGGILAWGTLRAWKPPAGHTRNRILLSAGCALAFLLPTSSLGVSATDTQGERFLYLASAFSCLAIPSLLPGKPGKRAWAPALLLPVCFLLLQGNHPAWRSAGRISRNLTARLLRCPPGRRVFLLNVPEKLEGAYIAPGPTTSLALEWLYPGAPLPRVFPGIPQRLTSPGQVTPARRKGKEFQLFFPGGAPRRLRAKAARLDFLELLEAGPKKAVLRIPGLKKGDLVFCFSAGTLHPL